MRTHQVGSGATIAELAFLGAERFGERPAQRFKRDQAWQDLTYAGLLDIVGEVALGLVGLGVRPGDRVCVLSETRPEWVQAEYAIAAAGAVVVPIYPSSSPQECEWVLADYLDCILHVFTPAARKRYRLEVLWGEAEELDLGLPEAESA